MASFLLDDFPFEVKVEAVMKALHMEQDDEEREMVETMVARFNREARPKAVYSLEAVREPAEESVTVGNTRIDSRLVAVNLKHTRRAAPYVATCGVEAAKMAEEYTDIYERYCADAIMLQLVGQATQYVGEYISKRYFEGAKLSRMSPGSLKEWPLPAQASIFGILGDVEEKCGVRLTESFLMLPHKSTSGLLFQAEGEYVNCAMCPIISCPNRGAPYDETLYEKKYGK